MTTRRRNPDKARAEREDDLRRRYLGATLSLTLLAGISYLTTVLLTRGRLPGSMATHFDFSGQADSFMSTTTALMFQGAVVVLLPLILVIAFWRAGWWRGEHARSVAATVCGLSMALTVMFVWLTGAHVDVADPATVQMTWRMGLLIFAAGAIAAAIVMTLLPAPLPRPAPRPVVPVQVAPSYRVSWFGRAQMGRGVVTAMMFSLVPLVVAAIVTGILWIWLLVALLVVMGATLSSFDVTVDSRGVRWSGAFGVPRGGAKLAAVSDVSVVDVQPGDFGGYGVRALPGRLGIITRSGRALRVVHGTRELVVTVDDPETAAGVLEGLRLKRKA